MRKEEVKILVVDDAAFMRLKLRDTLEKFGYQVIAEAKNGREGVEQYAKYRPNLVIMDLTMPELSGEDAVKEIKKLNPDANIIMCSAMGGWHNVVDAIQAGAKDFVVKPFEEWKVAEAVCKVMGTRGWIYDVQSSNL